MSILRSVLVLVLIFFTSLVHAVHKPELMLAKVFQPEIQVVDYWVSEKLDGVRARWNGRQLISRGGKVLSAPTWFTQGFPNQVLDGELWIAREQYQQTMSVISRKQAHAGWKGVKFMIFDLPNMPADFSARVSAMRQLVIDTRSDYLQMITQFQIASNTELMQRLKAVIEQGGEGLMLHHKAGLYQSGRSHDLLKLKQFSDAEATVISYRAGKGQFVGKMGAIKVQTLAGKVFFIGSGFTHQEREKPPAVGSVVTFRYQGFTDRGIPRFAVFIRVRDEP
ncbi:MAG: DNA ligase [Methyloprofundus sp.]|nr:DNA ligase [Methyloprofundus sp.]